VAEWSKAPDSSSDPRERAWVQISLLTFLVHSQAFFIILCFYSISQAHCSLFSLFWP
ncbi:unnamed protein product, partial [Linum tenue]